MKRFADAEPLGDQRWRDEHPYWTATDAEGRFELEHVPASEMSLGIDHPEWSLSIDGPFEVREGGTVVGRQIVVDLGLTLTGLLLDPDGMPLMGETIELQALETTGEKHRRKEATTDDTGAFLFENFLTGLYHARWVERRGEISCYHFTKLVEVDE